MKNVVSGVVGTATGLVRGGDADRSEAAQKAADTRAAAARKRSQAAKKAAQTRAEQAQARSDAAKKAARTRSRKATQRKSRVEAMVDAVRDDD